MYYIYKTLLYFTLYLLKNISIINEKNLIKLLFFIDNYFLIYKIIKK